MKAAAPHCYIFRGQQLVVASGGSHAKSYKDREVCMVEEIRVDFVIQGCCSSPVLL